MVIRSSDFMREKLTGANFSRSHHAHIRRSGNPFNLDGRREEELLTELACIVTLQPRSNQPHFGGNIVESVHRCPGVAVRVSTEPQGSRGGPQVLRLRKSRFHSPTHASRSGIQTPRPVDEKTGFAKRPTMSRPSSSSMATSRSERSASRW